MRRAVLSIAVFIFLLASMPVGLPLASAITRPRSAINESAEVASGATLAQTPAPVLAGAALAAPAPIAGAPEEFVYAFRGGDTKDFWKYNINDNAWMTAPDAPATVGDGASLVAIHAYTHCSRGSGQFCVAALRGANTSDFWMFDIRENRWCKAPDTPAPIGPGGAIAQLQRFGEIYALRGNGTRDFWKIDEQVGVWVRLADTPGPANAGGSLIGINYGTQSQRDVLYALQGGGSTAVWKYDVATDSWSHQSDVPGGVGPGGAVTAPPYGREGTLDVLQGGGSATIWSLDIWANTWSTLGDAPDIIQAGGTNSNQFAGCDFAFVGGGSTKFFSTGIRDCKAAALPDFSLSFEQPSIIASPGTKVKVTLNIVRTRGFAGSITISPVATTAGFRVPGEVVVTDEDKVGFKIKIKGGVQPGIYAVPFVGISGTNVHAAALVLIVQ